MAKIQIRNIGPVHDTGLVELTSVMLLIGPQSSGKSTFMKILCFCRWLEKMIMLNDEVIAKYTHNLSFLKLLCQFHRIDETSFGPSSYLRYEGDAVIITMEDGSKNVKIRRIAKKNARKYNTKIAFIPSERNLISAVKKIDQAYKSAESDALFNFIFEWSEAKDEYSWEHKKQLSFAPTMEYVNDDGKDMIVMKEGNRKLPTFYASSGVQSAMPIDVMTEYLTNQVGKAASVSKHDIANTVMRLFSKEESFTPEMLNDLRKKTNYQSVQLFVEEPEQNLHPSSQRDLLMYMVSSLIKAQKNGNEQSLLIMTTHSPYILSTLNVLMRQADALERQPDSETLKALTPQQIDLPKTAYSAFYINAQGEFIDLVDKDISMISGNELDGVSDWVDECISQINDVVYG